MYSSRSFPSPSPSFFPICRATTLTWVHLSSPTLVLSHPIPLTTPPTHFTPHLPPTCPHISMATFPPTGPGPNTTTTTISRGFPLDLVWAPAWNGMSLVVTMETIVEGEDR